MPSQPIDSIVNEPAILAQLGRVEAAAAETSDVIARLFKASQDIGNSNVYANINKSISDTQKLLPQLAAAQEKQLQQETQLTAVIGQKVKQYNDLGLAVNEYKKTSDQLAIIEAKLAASTSDEAKALAAKSVQLSEARKALIDEAKANNETIQARVNAKNAALDEAKAAKQSAADQKKANADIVQAAKDKIKADADAARQAKVNQKIEADLNNERKQLGITLKQQEENYFNVAKAKGRDSDAAKEALYTTLATRKTIDDLNGDLKNFQSNVGNYASGFSNFGNKASEVFGIFRTIAAVVPSLGIQGEFELIALGITAAAGALGIFSDKSVKASLEIVKTNEALTQYNKTLLENAELQDRVNKNIASFYSDINTKRQQQISLLQSQGASEGRLAEEQSKNSKTRLQDIENEGLAILEQNKRSAFLLGLDPAQRLKSVIDEVQKYNGQLLVQQEGLRDRLIKINTEISNNTFTKSQDVSLSKAQQATLDKLNSAKDAAQSAFDLNTQKIQQNADVINGFYEATSDASDKEADKLRKNLDADKQTFDKLRQLNLENLKARLSDQIAYSEQFADAEKLGALTQITEARKAAAERSDLLKATAASQVAQIESDRDFRIKNDQLTADEVVRLQRESAASVRNINTQLTIDLTRNAEKESSQVLKIKQQEIDRLKALVPPAPVQDLDTTPDRFVAQKHSLDQQAVVSAAFYQNEQLKLDTAHLKGLLSEKDYYKKTIENQKDGLGEQLKIAQKGLANLFTQNSDLIQKREELKSLLNVNKLLTPGDTEGQNKLKKDIQDTTDQIQQTNDTINATTGSVTKLQAELEKLGLSTPLDKLNVYFQQIGDTINGIFSVIGKAVDNNATRQKNALQAIEDQQELNYQAEVDRVNNSTLAEQDKAAKLIQLDAERTAQKETNARKEREIARQQAEFEKAATIAQIIVSTALAVIRTLGDPKLIALGINIPAAIAVGAIGAAQLAVAAAAPIPSFEHGTDNAPEGVARVSEKGAEMVIEPSGKRWLTPERESFVWLKGGSRVIPAHEVEAMMWNQTISKAPSYSTVNSTQTDMSKTERLLGKIAGKKWQPVIHVHVKNDEYRKWVKS